MRNGFNATVVSLKTGVGVVEAVVDIGVPLRVLVTAASQQQLCLVPGAEMYAAFKATSVRILKG